MNGSRLMDRLERFRSGGADGPSPTGFLLSVAESGRVMLTVHDLGLPDGEALGIRADGKSVRLLRGGVPVLQTIDAAGRTRHALDEATAIDVLELGADGVMRLHPAAVIRASASGVPGAS